MTDVLVERCVLRLVQRHPWGADRDEIVQRAIAALPALIGEAIADELAATGLDAIDGVLETPVRVTIPLRLSDLRFVELGLPPALRSPGSLSDRAARASVEAIRAAVAAEPALRARAAEPVVPAPPEPMRRPEESDPTAWRVHLVAQLLTWRRLGQLGAVLGGLRPQTLARIAATVLGSEALDAPHVAPARSEQAEQDRAVAAVLANEVRQSMPASAPRAAAQIALTLALAELWSTPTHAARVREAVWSLPTVGLAQPTVDASEPSDSVGPVEPTEGGHSHRDLGRAPAPAESAPAESAPPSAPTTPDRPEAQPAPTQHRARTRAATPAANRTTALTGEIAVERALPFLLLGSLEAIGWTRSLALGAALDEVQDCIGAVAMALARKVLPEPERGWRWSRGATQSAAAFCGSDPPPDGEALERADSSLEAAFGLATSSLQASLSAGHRPGAPLLARVATGGGGVVLFDTDGLFPLAWDLPGAEPSAMARLDCVLVPSDAADPALLHALHRSGAHFLTDAAPARDEAWRPLRRGRQSLWTNDPGLAVGPAIAAFREIDSRCRMADGFWESLAARPSDPHRRFGPLERAVTLAAGAALADLAWRLWQRREPTDGQLTLERFADLDARVVFGPSQVRVRLPMGLRHRDLYCAGLIDDVPGIPWLDDRALTFSGG